MDSIAAHLPDGWQRWANPAWLAHWKPRRFPLAGGTTDVVTMGEGPPLLLLPPLPGWKEAWLALAPRLAARFHVVTYDLRARFAGAHPWSELLDDLSRVADSLAPGPAVVVGHSLGGALAMRWALAHPERVRALVLSSSFARVTTPLRGAYARMIEQPLALLAMHWLPESAACVLAGQLAKWRRWVFDPKCDEHVRGVVLHGIRRIAIPFALGRVRLAFAHDLRCELPKLAVPVRIVCGERDTAFARDQARLLARLVPGAAAVAYSPGVGHLHPLSNPEWLADQIAGAAGATRA